MNECPFAHVGLLGDFAAGSSHQEHREQHTQARRSPRVTPKIHEEPSRPIHTEQKHPALPLTPQTVHLLPLSHHLARLFTMGVLCPGLLVSGLSFSTMILQDTKQDPSLRELLMGPAVAVAVRKGLSYNKGIITCLSWY